MDEEELEQPSSKINLGSFFERVDSVEKVANNALSRANANLGIISNQKLIINSLNVTIEAMETKIRDIANYIIIEKKLEKDVEEDRALEEQDRLQKQAMVERATTIMGEPGPQGEPGQPAEQQGGGSSLLGSLLRLGVGAFALKFLWPALLPLLKGSLTGLAGSIFPKIGAGIGIAVGGTLLSLPLLKRFKDPFQKKSEELGEKLGKSATNAINSIDEKGNVTDNSGDQIVSETNLVNGDESMRDTLSEKDLMVTPGTRIDEYGAEGGGEPSSGDLSMFDEEEEEPKKKTITKEQIIKMSKDYKALVEKGKDEGLTRKEEFQRKKLKIILDNIGVETRDLTIMGGATIEDVNKAILQVNPNAKEAPRFGDVGGLIEFENKNKDLDLSSDNVDSDMTQAIAKTNERIDNLIGGENKEQNNGNLVSANKPNVTEATLKLASAPLPFVKVIKNNQLSTSPKSYNGLPPEIAAMIS